MSDVPDYQVPRRLFVAWRNPDSRQIIPVGLLLQGNESGVAAAISSSSSGGELGKI